MIVCVREREGGGREGGREGGDIVVSILSISVPFEPPATVLGKFMVCTGHRLQCKMPARTNHKFPGYGIEKF